MSAIRNPVERVRITKTPLIDDTNVHFTIALNEVILKGPILSGYVAKC